MSDLSSNLVWIIIINFEWKLYTAKTLPANFWSLIRLLKIIIDVIWVFTRDIKKLFKKNRKSNVYSKCNGIEALPKSSLILKK